MSAKELFAEPGKGRIPEALSLHETWKNFMQPMKTKMLLFLTLLLFNLSSYGSPDLSFSDATEITAGSFIHGLIEKLAENLFDSPMRKPFCNVYSGRVSLVYGLGISVSAADRILANCNLNKADTMTKIFPKKYYLVPRGYHNLDSWTDLMNRTYIFTDEELSAGRLQKILIHEVVIATDAKLNMMPTTYLRYNIDESKIKPGKTIVISTDDIDEKIKRAFLFSTWAPVRDTFAAMRAFKFEELVLNEEIESLEPDHDDCVQLFYQIFNQLKQMPVPKHSDSEQMVAMLPQMLNENSMPKSESEEQENLEFILNKKLKLKNQMKKKVSFCQYMASPLITNSTTYNLYGSGPRPRLTGGSGGQGSGQ